MIQLWYFRRGEIEVISDLPPKERKVEFILLRERPHIDDLYNLEHIAKTLIKKCLPSSLRSSIYITISSSRIKSETLPLQCVGPHTSWVKLYITQSGRYMRDNIWTVESPDSWWAPGC
jgi:hypothetical protein